MEKPRITNTNVKFKILFGISHHDHCNTAIKRHLFSDKDSRKNQFYLCFVITSNYYFCRQL